MSLETIVVPLHGIKASEWDAVQAILRDVLPGKQVWAFGSRATGNAMLRRFSDLDLAVEGKLTLSEMAEVRDAFEESLLPFKVDVVELDAVGAEFRARIERDFVPVQTSYR